MKKVLKIFGAIILCLGVIALIVCMCAIPNETKLFFDSVFEYLDKPIILCGVSVTIGGVLLFFITRYILNNTSVGKKHLKALEEELKDLRKDNNDITNYLNERISNLSFDLSKYEIFEDNRNKQLKEILSLIPNKKVQEALNNGKETKNN